MKLFVLVAVFLTAKQVSSVTITGMDIHSGSISGGTIVRIHGNGFAPDSFNFGGENADLGNKVYLYSATQKYLCDVEKDASDENTITFETKEMKEGMYNLELEIDGKAISPESYCSGNPYACSLQITSSKTPLLSTIMPATSTPGSELTLEGRFFTNRTQSADEESSNGNTASIRRIWIGGRKCEMYKAPDELYGVELNRNGDWYSDWGWIKCLHTGNFVGSQNISLLIDNDYGRAKPGTDMIKLSSDYQLYTYQTYAVTKSVAPVQGSTQGGTVITLTGNYYDDDSIDVKLGGNTCAVVDRQDTSFTCTTPPSDVIYSDIFPGGRGVLVEIFHGLTAEDQIDSGSSEVEIVACDTTEISHTASTSPLLARMRGFFIPAKSGEYSFWSNKPDVTVVRVSTDHIMSNAVLRSKDERMTLEGGQEYFYEVVHTEATDTLSFQLAAYLAESDYVYGQTSMAVPEKQTISASSPDIKEVQKITLNNWVQNESPVNEKFELCIPCTTGYDCVGEEEYVMILDGIATKPLTSGSSAAEIKKWIEQFPTLGRDTVTVEKIANSDTCYSLYNIVIDSNRGGLNLQAESIDKSKISANLSISTGSKASLTSFTMAINGIPSPHIPVGDGDSLVKAVTSLYSVLCPPGLDTNFGSDEKIFSDFENPNGPSYGGRIILEDSFCGSRSLQVSRQFKMAVEDKIYIVDSLQVCFAYKGAFTLNLHYFYTSTKNTLTSGVFTAVYDESENWKHTCRSLRSLKTHGGAGYRHYLSGEWLELTTSNNEFFLDNVFLGVVAWDEHEIQVLQQMRRLRLVDDIGVDDIQASNSGDEYTVTISPLDCATGLPLLEAAYGTKQESDAESDTVTYTSPSWGNASITIRRVTHSAPPIGGDFTLTLPGDGDLYGGETELIPWNALPGALEKSIEALNGINDVTVTRQGNCRSFEWSVLFESPGGWHGKLVPNGNFKNEDATISVETTQDGGLNLIPIPGDWIRTAHDKPQVQVTINNVISLCDGDCSFTYDESLTPTVKEVNIDNFPTIEITGTGFSTDSDDNVVKIDNLPCEAASSPPTETTLSCIVNNLPAGTNSLIVHVVGKGNSSPFSFKTVPGCSAETLISPASGSVEGGTEVNIQGITGIDNSVSVKIGDTPCVVSNVNGNNLKCITSSSVAGMVDVSIEMGGESHSCSLSYTFENALAVGTLSPQKLSLLGGDLTITGSGFGDGSSNSFVHIGTHTAAIVSWTDSEITATAPSLPPNTYTVRVNIPPFGDAELTPKKVEYVLVAENVLPTTSSLMGGRMLTISGDGFDDSIKVTVGESECKIKTRSLTTITCIMGSCGKTHAVKNTGQSAHGIGYAWNPSKLAIRAGDRVAWSWSQLTGSSGAAYQVFSIATAAATAYDNNGFASGNPTSSGSFVYQFNIPGVYHYGGYANGHIIFMTGVVTVQDAVDISVPLSLQLGGYDVDYSDEVEVSCRVDLTPTVTEITPRSGTSDDLITISGTGFSTGGQTVYVGDAECSVDSVNETAITCKVGTDTELTVGLHQEVTVKVADRGSSRSDIRDLANRFFVLLPHIASVSPTTGSLAGGTTITVSGGGLSHCNSIVIEGVTCGIVSKSYTSVKCVTAPSVLGQYEVKAEVFENSKWMIPKCISTACAFEYRTEDTPVVNGVTPTVAVGPVEVTITGTGLGDSSITSVLIGETACNVIEAADDAVKCTVDGLPVGENRVRVLVDGKGYADNGGETYVISSEAVISGISPVAGSVHGGTSITISGNGFVNSTVMIGDNACHVSTVTLSTITCVTVASPAGTQNLVVTSNGLKYESQTFEYSDAKTPLVSAVAPASGKMGDVILLTISILGEAEPSVQIGGINALLDPPISDGIKCVLGSRYGGKADIVVNVPGYGLAEVAEGVVFEYLFEVSSVHPISGSLGGGQSITLQGNGFSSLSEVKVCGEECTVIGEVTATSITCVTPASSEAVTCDVEVANTATDVRTLENAFSYDKSRTPEVTSVQPSSGGTGGGTLLTISGEALSGVTSVEIDGSECGIDPATITNTGFMCTTEPHIGTINAKVEVRVGDDGIAPTENANFYYVDRWSSVFTWGGSSVPQEGEFIIIQKDQTVLMDTITAQLSMLLIQGGSLIFEDGKVDEIHLHADNILIINGGLLQIGTEEKPFTSRAAITMHGHLRSQELPIYGAKTLGVREGRLEMHGKPTVHTWSMLEETANAGSKQIKLMHEVDWPVGAEIVVASTGLRHSQSENEQHEIAGISIEGGRSILTLTEDLKYEHLGVSESYDVDGETVNYDYRAEVGLLTRNVVFRGSDDKTWHDDIKRCEQGFNTGQFATQTCFQGRFGEEEGADEYGGSIMIHSKEPTSDPENGLAIAHIEYVELTYVGQAYRLGRYPIHWHLMGNMTGNYVRGCAIHKSFNRAVTIHNTHNLLVERNVVYNVMGGALFIEDGIETQNVLQYNLAVFVRQSTSLLNDDITPAAYWVTNPDNIIQHNHAAGGTHFGYWYRMHTHPDGPSYTPSICQQNVELGIFRNNSAHSQGWYGLWIFQTYIPKEGGSCWSNVPMAAKFHSLKAWHCEKGAEWVTGGAIQFHEFALSSNEKQGIDIRAIIGTEWDKGDRGALIKSSTIIGHAKFWEERNPNYETGTGIVMPLYPKLWIDGVNFININRGTNAALSAGGHKCTQCGGFEYWVENLKFSSVTARIRWRWEHEGVVLDIDGSLTGTAGSKVISSSDLYNDGKDCVLSEEPAFGYNAGRPSTICGPDVGLHRFAFNQIAPESLKGNNVLLENDYGNSSVPNLFKRMTHMEGWMAVLRSRQTYTMTFQNAKPFSNVSYSGTFYNFRDDEYVIMKSPLSVKPDRIYLFNGDTSRIGDTSEMTADSPNRDWHYDTEAGMFSFKIGGSESDPDTPQAYGIAPRIFRCLFPDCIPPVDTGSHPDVNVPEGDITFATNFTSQDCFSVTGETDEDRDVYIPQNCWVFWTMQHATVNRLYVKGNLQFDPSLESIELIATYIIVEGRMIAGLHYSDPFTKSLHIKMRGNTTTDPYIMSYGLSVGAKTIACVGVCDLHGLHKEVTWTKLEETVAAGSKQIVLQSQVDWEIGDEIVIAPSGYNAWHTEKNIIASISQDGKTIGLQHAVKYEHTAAGQDFGNEWQIDMSSEVGVLTRNIKIEGELYDGIEEDAFGARVLVNTVLEKEAKIRFSNVEFIHSGQLDDSTYPHNSIALYYAGIASVIRDCAFHDGFSPAIGTYGTAFVNITGNVIHHPVGDGIIIAGEMNRLENNLVLLVVNPATYLNRTEDSADYWAGINIESSLYLTMTDNAVAGAERCAYKIVGQSCNSAPSLWSGNVGHAVIVGTYQMASLDNNCSLVTGFIIYKALDYGMYHQTTDSVETKDCAIIDATIGYLPIVTGPAALTHEIKEKYAKVSDSLFVGRSDQTVCSTDVDESTDENLILRSKHKPRTTPSGGRSAIMLPMFASGSNGAPKKTFTSNKLYPAIYGVLLVESVTMANYGKLTSSGCSGITDVLFITNPSNEDASHPVHTKGLILNNVELSSYAFVDRPNRGKINPSDCVDMPCDAKLKVVIKDTDGSLFGYTGSIISQSEKDWGSQSLGVGDFRIPKTMLTTTDGTRIPVDDLVPDKGIARTDACEYNELFQAYECAGIDALDYLVLVIESLDADTETRRLSPVAVKVGTYIDLLNGPQDHGWCAGYTCQKRISTFHAVVPANQHIDLFFTSTPPQRTRFHLLNGKTTDKVTIGVWIPNPQKLDVHDGSGQYVRPVNAYDGADGKMRLSSPPASDPDKYILRPDTASPGDNYLDFTTRVLYVCVGGENPTLTIVTKPTIIVSFGFPAITVNEFFEERIVDYLAALLSIPTSKIRRVNVVRETSRRKRSTESTTTFDFELEADTPEAVNEAGDKAMDTFQRKEMSIEGATPTTMTTTRALTSELVKDLDEKLKGDRYVNNVDVVTVPTKISVATNPAGEEASVLVTAPAIHILDDEENLVITSTNWKVTVSLDKSHANADPSATLEGTKELSFIDGVAEFDDLVISHSGNYKLTFTPSESTLAAVESDEFELNVRTIGARITRLEQSGLAIEGSELKFDLQLTDGSSNNLQDLDFKGYTYKIDVAFDGASMYGNAALAGTTTFDFDGNGQLTTDGLSLTGTENYLVYNLKFTLYTDPASTYDVFVGIEKIQVYPSNAADYIHEDFSYQKSLTLEFSEDYDTVLGATAKETFETGFYNELVPQYPTLYMTPFTLEKTTDRKLRFHTIIAARNESYVTQFIENLAEARSLRSGDTVINLADICGIAVNGVCEKGEAEVTTMADNTTAADIPVAIGNDDSNATTIIFAVLGACVFLAICIVATTYLVKRSQASKVSALRCMNTTPTSERPLNDSLDDFQSGSQEFSRGSPDLAMPHHVVA